MWFLNREMIGDELHRDVVYHKQWMEVRNHIRLVFYSALEATMIPNTVRYQCDPCRMSQLRENVIR